MCVTGIGGAGLPTSEQLDPGSAQRLRDTLARAVDLEATFDAHHELAVNPSSRLRQDEAVGNAASVFNTASVALIGALDHLRTW